MGSARGRATLDLRGISENLTSNAYTQEDGGSGILGKGDSDCTCHCCLIRKIEDAAESAIILDDHISKVKIV